MSISQEGGAAKTLHDGRDGLARLSEVRHLCLRWSQRSMDFLHLGETALGPSQLGLLLPFHLPSARVQREIFSKVIQLFLVVDNLISCN